MNDTEMFTIEVAGQRDDFDDSQLAAVAFLARYSDRTLDAYRHDLRDFFAWATTAGVGVLAATRPHIELYRHHMEQRGLAASTIDRRLSTVCGFYGSRTSMGRLRRTRRSTCGDPRSTPVRDAGSIAASWAGSCSLLNASTGTTLRWRCCSA